MPPPSSTGPSHPTAALSRLKSKGYETGGRAGGSEKIIDQKSALDKILGLWTVDYQQNSTFELHRTVNLHQLTDIEAILSSRDDHDGMVPFFLPRRNLLTRSLMIMLG